MEDLKKIREEGCVEILGYQKDIPSLYSRSHIICLPSYREGLPKTTFGSCGKQVEQL